MRYFPSWVGVWCVTSLVFNANLFYTFAWFYPHPTLHYPNIKKMWTESRERKEVELLRQATTREVKYTKSTAGLEHSRGVLCEVGSFYDSKDVFVSQSYILFTCSAMLIPLSSKYRQSHSHCPCERRSQCYSCGSYQLCLWHTALGLTSHRFACHRNLGSREKTKPFRDHPGIHSGQKAKIHILSIQGGCVCLPPVTPQALLSTT